ncbi:monocarboxylate transporter 5 isoform X1 [Parasteatoda tepidariorum]|uniref:monocarboxylate transporter 5 isoform X1 n=1 Tax=Parasteatoda tepidariorum TaxID=114398 RepID=UPI00077FD1FE|nr:uncharacterized protein LOC107450710 isoform X1 [Parasteatoda tepidariorum]XP_015922054.1 uncharacterized protein LOC107450710 isoform X1 [Parasteatoda tepidariorum]XP_015922055.1 uncharacterized protein LOC107450710 isoform X1 [Parasteatoda tepidariorum]
MEPKEQPRETLEGYAAKGKGLKSWNSWRVLIASSVVFCLILPPFKMFALFYVAVIEQYEIERDLAAIPFVVLAIVRALSGLAFGILVERFGLQCMAFVGCSLAAIGVSTSYFAQGYIILSVTLGLFYGFGFTVTALLPSIIRDYFDNDSAAISNGLLNLGPSVCSIAFPSIIIYFLNEYGLSGTFLLTSGIILNAIPFVIILHKPVATGSKRALHNKTYLEDINKDNDLQADSLLNEERTDNDLCIPAKCNEYSPCKDGPIESTLVFEETVSHCPNHVQTMCSFISNSSGSTRCHQLHSEAVDVQELDNVSSKHAINNSKVTKSVDDKPPLSTLHQKRVYFMKMKTKQCISKGRRNIWHPLAVMKDPTFIALSITQSLFAYTLIVVLTTMIDYSRDKNIDRTNEIYMLTFQPIPDIVGRLGLTWVTDKKYLSVSGFGAIMHLVMAASSVWMALSNSFGMMIAGIMLISFAIGGMNNIIPGMSYSYIAKDKQTFAVTSFGFLYAPLSLTVSPLIGYFRGNLGSYDGLYYLLTAMNIFCSITVLLLPWLSNVREKKEIKRHSEIQLLKRTDNV